MLNPTLNGLLAGVSLVLTLNVVIIYLFSSRTKQWILTLIILMIGIIVIGGLRQNWFALISWPYWLIRAVLVYGKQEPLPTPLPSASEAKYCIDCGKPLEDRAYTGKTRVL